MYMEIFVMLIVILFFFIIGIVFSNGKGAFLIAGYNTMSKEEKDKYDTVALCKSMGKLMFSLCGSMIFWLLAIIFDTSVLFVIGMILFVIFLVVGLIYMGKEDRFKKK